jgi:hypothetical protein
MFKSNRFQLDEGGRGPKCSPAVFPEEVCFEGVVAVYLQRIT